MAPGAKYMKNCLSGVRDFCWRTQVMARSVMSSVKWYPCSGLLGGSTGVIPSYRAGYHWFVSAPTKP